MQGPGPAGHIDEPILHDAFPRIERHLAKINSYSSLSAQEQYEKGNRASIPGAMLRGVGKFMNRYLIQAGFLDGKEGLILAVNAGFYAYLKHVKLWEEHRLAAVEAPSGDERNADAPGRNGRL